MHDCPIGTADASLALNLGSQNINHYNVLRTIEQMAGVAYLGQSSQATAISGIWE